MDPEDQNGLPPGADTTTSTGAAATGGANTGGGGSNNSGIDFTQFKPSNEGLQQLDIWKMLANVLMYVGYGAAFLAFLVGLIMWAIGHKIGGRHVLEEAKTTILRAMFIGIALGSSGALWNWLMTR